MRCRTGGLREEPAGIPVRVKAKFARLGHRRFEAEAAVGRPEVNQTAGSREPLFPERVGASRRWKRKKTSLGGDARLERRLKWHSQAEM